MDKKQLKQILDNALSTGGDFAEIFIEEKETTGIGYEDQKIEKLNSGIDIGAGIRVISGDTTAYVYTNVVTTEELGYIAQVASKVAQSEQKSYTLDFTTPEAILDFEITLRPDQIKIEDKIEKVMEVEKLPDL